MVVAVLTTSYPRHAGDYAGSFVAEHVARLRAAGHEVEVLAAGEADATAVEDGVRVTRLAGGGLFYGAGAPETLERGHGAAWLAAARFTAALASAARARQHAWARIEAHWLVPCALAAAAAAPRLPRVGYAHSGDVALLERLPLGRAIARQLARGTTLRFVSAELRARFARLVGTPESGEESIGTVEPMAPAPLFVPRAGADVALRQSLGLRGPTVLAVGRLVPIKGHDRLLRACARVAATGAGPLEVVILGDGPDRAQLDRRAAALGLALRLPGFVPRAEVARWLRAADVFAHPSIRLPNGRGEGAPVAEREARAVGIPVVAGDDPALLAAGILDALAAHPTAGHTTVAGV